MAVLIRMATAEMSPSRMRNRIFPLFGIVVV